MRIELWCLVINALWGLVLVFVEVNGKTKAGGLQWNMGNRDSATTPTFPPWVERAGRALANHKENFPLFATAVLVAAVSGHLNQVTMIAAIVYAVARVLHGVVYIAGITGVRSAMFIVGTLAAVTIYSQLLF